MINKNKFKQNWLFGKKKTKMVKGFDPFKSEEPSLGSIHVERTAVPYVLGLLQMNVVVTSPVAVQMINVEEKFPAIRLIQKLDPRTDAYHDNYLHATEGTGVPDANIIFKDLRSLEAFQKAINICRSQFENTTDKIKPKPSCRKCNGFLEFEDGVLRCNNCTFISFGINC